MLILQKGDILTYDYGHRTSGDGGAVGILNEESIVREYGSNLINKLIAFGIQCIDCTPPSRDYSLNSSLAYRVNKANEYSAKLHLCMHANCFDGTGHGCEVYHYSTSESGKDLASRMSANISAALGVTNRGAKVESLYVINNTIATAILVEPIFIDNIGDTSAYSAEKISNAMFYSLTGQVYSSKPVETPKSVKQLAPNYDESKPSTGNLYCIPNTNFYIEQAADGRMMIHLDRGNYIAIGKGFIDAYVNDNKGHNASKRIIQAE